MEVNTAIDYQLSAVSTGCKMTRRDFLITCGRAVLALVVFSTLPLDIFTLKKYGVYIPYKTFKRSDLRKSSMYAG